MTTDAGRSWTPEHHDQPMRWRGTGHTWEGEFAIEERRYACADCPTTAVITTREHVGPVSDAASSQTPDAP